MVRGRRTRRAAASSATTSNSTTITTATNGSLSPLSGHGPLSQQNGLATSAKGSVVLMEDFCCASPKRKEYKLDELLLKNGSEMSTNGFNGRTIEVTNGTTSSSTQNKRVLRGNQNSQQNVVLVSSASSTTTTTTTTNGRLCPVAGNEITRFLLSQSKSKSRKTRKKSPNFELVNDDTCDSFTHATTLSQNGEAPLVVKMEAEDEEEVVELVEEETPTPFQMFGRVPVINEGNSNEADNIFLQEPVLKLTVDESVLVQHKQQPQKRPGKDAEAAAQAAAAAVAILNQDSNSGDSGVVVDKLQEAAAAASVNGGGVTVTPKAAPLLSVVRQRKPTTPHRILCPSSPQNGNPVKEEPMNGDVEEEHENVQMTKRQLNLPTKEDEDEEEVLKQDVKQEAPQSQPEEQQKPPQSTTTMKPPPKNGVKGTTNTMTNGHQSTMEDFFKVRRSVRKTKKEVEREEQLAIEKAILAACDEGLAVKHFENKGRGIVATRPFARGEFVVEYVGEFISIAEANRREKLYAQDQNTGCYMYYFKHKNKQFCIDATEETGKLGRLVNHSRNGNLMTRTVEVRGQPHLVLIAKEDIEQGRELTYDYGDRSKESLLHHPWLAY